MQQVAWTDDRIDDLAQRMDAGFAAARDDIRLVRDELRGEIGLVRDELRGEIGQVRDELRGEIGQVRDELRGEIGQLRGEMGQLRGEMGQLRGEMGELRREIHDDIGELRMILLRFGGGLLLALAAVMLTQVLAAA